MKKQEIKNFFWGIIAPFIMVFIFKSWWGYLLTAGIAILIQVAIGKKEAAAKTLEWTLIPPIFVFMLAFIAFLLA